ncbi:MAG: helix-turn-helix domain-containing protein [Bulleidia sp.]
MKDIGKNIRTARINSHLNQQELADLLHVTRQTVSNYETGKSRPDIEMLESIAQVLNIDLQQLIYGIRKNPLQQNRRSVFIRAAIFITLLIVYLCMYPYAVNQKSMYYNMIPTYVVLMIVIPCLIFAFGQLCGDLLYRHTLIRITEYRKPIAVICAVILIIHILIPSVIFTRVLFPSVSFPGQLDQLVMFLWMGPASFGLYFYFRMFLVWMSGITTVFLFQDNTTTQEAE